MPTSVLKGSCLCGEVHFELSPPFTLFQYCFCSRCRKLSGTGHAANILIPPEQFSWLQGEAQIERYEVEEARHFATCFCRKCGSKLPWLAQSGRTMVIPAGSLDDEPEQRPHANVFWESRADWYQLPTELDTYATLPGKSDACRLDKK